MKNFFLIILSLNLFNSLQGQIKLVTPHHNDSINYRQIMFEYEQVDDAYNYELEVSSSSQNFEKDVFLKKLTSKLVIRIDSGLNFGNSYYWRIKALHKNGNIINTSNISNFYILKTKLSSSTLIKQEVKLYQPMKMFNGLIVYDYGVIANKKGEIVWFLPDNEYPSRNVNLNPDGTITFNSEKGSFETDLKGKQTWKAPFTIFDSILIKNYHHDFKKLKNGHFLCLAEKLTSDKEKIYSIIFEIDRKNTIYWKWDEEPTYNKRNDNISSNHVNAIDIDSNGEYVYLSNRNLNSITKIKTYSDSSYIVNHIGNIKNRFFSGQHSVSVLPNNKILLFNNNTLNANSTTVSSIQEINQVQSSDTIIDIVWEYKFAFEKMEENKCSKAGDADLLPNKNILISSGANNRVFEVNRKKQIVWESLSYRRDRETDIFTPQPSYRAHYCSSLYPNYFTVQSIGNKNLKLKKKQKIKFSVNNDGSENDEYIIKITSTNAIVDDLNFTCSIPAEQSKKKVLTIKPKNVGEIKITIYSKTNLLKSKTIIYKVDE